jgi:hypothetical protein
MQFTVALSLLASAVGALAQKTSSGTVWATPHEQYSSSVGVLGCLVNTNRIAYWPASIDCTNICIRLSHAGRSVHLLRVDQSEGAYDVSYDAWNYLYTGKSASEAPTTGGPLEMEFETVDAEECADLILTDDGRLPLSASNSMNYLASCLAQPDSWVAGHYQLYNVLDPVCAWGTEEKCDLDWPAANQAECPSGLGVPSVLKDSPVYNIQYGTGKSVLASSGVVVDDATPAKGASMVRYTAPGFSVALPANGKAVTVSGGKRGFYVPLSLVLPIFTFFLVR